MVKFRFGKSIETQLRNEIYTKKNSRKIFLEKIGHDYSGDWQGARYFDLWGGNNHFYGRTLSSVDGTKGHNYKTLIDLCDEITRKK